MRPAPRSACRSAARSSIGSSYAALLLDFVDLSSSDERRERIACRQRDNSVAEQSKAVQPSGQPISHSTNEGFSRGDEVWRDGEDSTPGSLVGWSGWEKWETCVAKSSDPVPSRLCRAKSGPLGDALGLAHLVCDSSETCRLPLAVVPFDLISSGVFVRPPEGTFGVIHCAAWSSILDLSALLEPKEPCPPFVGLRGVPQACAAPPRVSRGEFRSPRSYW